MPNRLANETSPYLLQHKDNPVDWYPWGEEAFAKARAEDKPVFLSVGYSSCHWCHVMEHESFEDEEVARALNERFVSVKVDREERPDVDEAYMTAVQLMSGRGGWPMSAFLTPDRKPFFAGTYFPKHDRGGHPGFMTLCHSIGELWRTRRGEVEEQAGAVADAVRDSLNAQAPATFAALDETFLGEAVRGLASTFDAERGGFGSAPKFPPHTSLEFLMGYALRPTAPVELREAALGMALLTLERIALGGIHDHVGGGFHRYSTDENWLLPHFEKMLYDNALMLGNFARGSAFAQGVEPRLERLFLDAARGIVGWLQREMASPEGFLYSALDADSEGEEGKFYVWTDAEVREVLGERADGFLETYNFHAEGNFRDEATHELTGANIPHLSADDGGRFHEDLDRLLEARAHRVPPGLDYKALVSWNGLAIDALATAGVMPMAERAATAILEAERELGELPHQISRGKASGPAFLDDYANFIHGLLTLAARGEAQAGHWRAEAARLCGEMVARFYDEERGGFFSTSEGHEELFGRSKPSFDQPIPSGNAIAIRCLIELGDEERARRSVEAFLGWMQRAPHATEALYFAALPLVATESALPPAPAPTPQAVAQAPDEVTVTLSRKELVADASGRAAGEIVIRIPAGIHLNASEVPARWLTPTRLEIQPLKSTVSYPAGEGDYYEGEVTIPFEVELPAGESGAEFEVRVKFQPCTETECLLPRERVLNAVAVR